MSKTSHYRDTLGFDRTTHVPFTKQFNIACSSCEALVINGYPTHERGCPNAKRECGGCNTLIPWSPFHRFCEDCQ